MTRNFGVHAQKKRVQPPKTLNTATQRKYGTGLPTTTNDLPSMRNDGDCQVWSDAESMAGTVTIASVRAHGVRQLLVYCLGKREGDWPCHHSGKLPIVMSLCRKQEGISARVSAGALIEMV
jgi:hypothetical protein